jgi:hypothetical protein
MIRLMYAVLATATLVACTDGQPLPEQITIPAEASRAYADLFQDQPFDTASISVVATERSQFGRDILKTFELRPCQNGTRVCGTQPGSVQQTPDYYIVTGAYPGRTFHLSPGGDGYMQSAAGTAVVAWN